VRDAPDARQSLLCDSARGETHARASRRA